MAAQNLKVGCFFASPGLALFTLLEETKLAMACKGVVN